MTRGKSLRTPISSSYIDSASRFEEQLNTIFEVTHSSNFNTSIQAMTLIQQISATKHYSTDRFYRTLYESLLDPRLITTSKHIMYLNLLYRSLKADISIKRVQAFVKRLLQIIHLHEPPFICGVLYLINELITTFPSIKSMLSTPEDNASDSGEEHYEDVPEDDEGKTAKDTQSKRSRYNPRKRDPDHAEADLSCLWELLPLQAHYHPSVHVLASKLLNQEIIKEKPDPTIYTLMNFLDKFSFRNARTKPQSTHGASIMQPMSGTAKAADYLISSRDGDRTHDALNSEQFWRKKVDDVRVDEVFFHTYFEKAGKSKQAKKAEKKKSKKQDDDTDGSEEEEIWKALVNSRPEIEGDEDDEEDFSDIDMEDMMSEDDADGVVGIDEGVELNLGSDEEDAVDGVSDDDGENEDGFDDLNLDDEDAFMDSDEDVSVDIDMDDDTDVEESGASKSKKKEKDDTKGRKKRKLKHLPTFASADDYAKLLGSDDSE